MTDVSSSTPSREQRVYRAVVRHAVPYVVYIALIGFAFGLLFGVIASFLSVNAIDIPIIAFYAILGSLIGVVIAARPVVGALLAFPWGAEGHEEQAMR